MKCLLLVLTVILVFAAPGLAACEKCTGEWPGMSCTGVGEGESGNDDCETDTWGWCTHSGDPCTPGGACDDGNTNCEIDNRVDLGLPVVPPGETRVLPIDPVCASSELIIEA